MLAVLMIIGGVLLRLTPHIPNFAPIAATALFGGTYLSKRFALVVPLIAMAISDYLLLYIHPFQSPYVDFSHVYPITALFYPSTFAVWGSFILVACIGMWLKNHKNVKNIIFGSLMSSVLFFLITNFGFWLTNDMYPKTFNGQIEAYIMALPFFRWTVMGDLFYTGVFFGAYELAIRTAYRLKTQSALSFNSEKEEN